MRKSHTDMVGDIETTIVETNELGISGELLDSCLGAIHSGYREQISSLQKRCEKLESALATLVRAAKAYMGYHGDKFYGKPLGRMDGLNPAISAAEEAMEPDGQLATERSER